MVRIAGENSINVCVACVSSVCCVGVSVSENVPRVRACVCVL